MRPTPNPLLDARPGIGRVGYRIRWEVLTRQLEYQGDVHPDISTHPAITVSTTANIRRVLRGFTLTANDARDLRFQSDRIAPVLELEDGSGPNQRGGWPLGVFMLSGRDRQAGSAHTLVNATLLDQGQIINQKMSKSFGLRPQEEILPKIQELAETSGVPEYSIAGGDTATYPRATLKFKGARKVPRGSGRRRVGGVIAWPMGTLRSAIFDQLCQLSGLAPPWFTSSGLMVIDQLPEAQPGNGHLYDVEGLSVRIEAGSMTLSDNLLGAYNIYVVTCTNANSSQISARSYIDPRLPHSVENIGYEVPSVTSLQGVYDTAHAQEIADNLAAADPAQLETATFTSMIDPRHETFDVVEFREEIWRETDWTLQLTGKLAMTHKLVKKLDLEKVL